VLSMIPLLMLSVKPKFILPSDGKYVAHNHITDSIPFDYPIIMATEFCQKSSAAVSKFYLAAVVFTSSVSFH
jgi:hypothetical protein